MYKGNVELLIKNPPSPLIDIDSRCLGDTRKSSYGSLTIYIRKDSPGRGTGNNWLPALDAAFLYGDALV